MEQQIDQTVNNYLSGLRTGKYSNAILITLLILYGTAIAPKLPPYILQLFDHPVVKLLVFFLITYLSVNASPTVAIITALCVMITVHTLNKVRVDYVISSLVRREKMENLAAMENSEDMSVSDDMSVPDDMSIESQEFQEIQADTALPEAYLEDLQEDNLSGMIEGAPIEPEQISQPEESDCQVSLKYRDSFYPQYVNMDKSVYDAKKSGGSVAGFDHGNNFASV